MPRLSLVVFASITLLATSSFAAPLATAYGKPVERAGFDAELASIKAQFKGNPKRTWTPELEATYKRRLLADRLEDVLLSEAIARHKPASNSLLYKLLFGGDVTTEIVFMLPGFRWEVVENATSRLFTLTCLTPENESSTRITQVTYWQNSPLLDVVKPFLIPGFKQFLDQDGHMVDLQNTGLAYQKTMLMIDDIDVQAKWYRTLKKEWAAARSEGRPFVNPIEPRVLRWRS